jgi:hypothetical protein
VLRGFAFAFAVAPDDQFQNSQIRWNHLSGSAILVNYALSTAAEYSAMAFQAAPFGDTQDDVPGDPVGTPGILNLNGQEYSWAPDKLLFDFYANGSTALSGQLATVFAESDITLHPASADLRQDGNGRVTTKAVFDIWNQNEVRFSGTEKCVSCWDQTLVRNYPAPNHLLRQNLQTAKGKARVNGVGSAVCVSPGVATVPPYPVDTSENAALLGIMIKQLVFVPPGEEPRVQFAASAVNMAGQGDEAAVIRYDLVDLLRTGSESIDAGETGEAEQVEPDTKARAGIRGGR